MMLYMRDQENYEKGYAEGYAEGYDEYMTLALKYAVNNLGLSIDEAMDKLDIPCNKREIFRKVL